MSKSRLEAFSDGVMAIILTILVLDIKLPPKYSWSILWDTRMQFITYIASFLLVAMIWNQHHQMFAAVKAINGKILWSNSLLLFWLSLIPVAENWYGNNIFAVQAGVLFSAVNLSFNISFFILSHFINQEESNRVEHSERQQFTRLSLISFIANVLCLLLAFIFPPIVLIAIFLNALIWFVPLSASK